MNKLPVWVSIYFPQLNKPEYLNQMAQQLLQYTPELSMPYPNLILLNVSASLSLFKGPIKLLQRIRLSLEQAITLANQPHAFNIGMAPTAMGAWLLAVQTQSHRRRVIRINSLKQKLNNLHVLCLPSAKPYIELLNSLGCTTLGKLYQLPQASLAQRTSQQLVHELNAAYGKAKIYFNWYTKPESFKSTIELDFHTTNSTQILLAAQSLVQKLCLWLSSKQLATNAMVFTLSNKNSNHPSSSIHLNFSQTVWLAKPITKLLAEKTTQLKLYAPVAYIKLHHVSTQARAGYSYSLFPDHGQQIRQEKALLDILTNRLGTNAVLKPLITNSHLPEQASQWISVDNVSGSNAKITAPVQLNRPFWLLEHAMPLTTKQNHPVYLNQKLSLIHGPERIESGWWAQQHEQRDYYVAVNKNHQYYWVYLIRGSGSPLWYLHGLFA